MALNKLTTIRVFPNDPDKKATHGNSNWKPYKGKEPVDLVLSCLLYTSPSPRDGLLSRMPSSA